MDAHTISAPSLSLSDLLELEASCMCDNLQECREVAPLFAHQGLDDFKPDLQQFLQRGLAKADCSLDRFDAVCSTTSAPWRFPQQEVDEIVANIINAFQQPLSLGESVFCAALGHLNVNLDQTTQLLEVFERLRKSLDAQAKRQEQAQQARTAQLKAKAAKARAKREGTKTPGKESGTTRKAQGAGDQHAASEAHSKEVVPKAPDCLEIIAMARRLVPSMDIETVREVQGLVGTDLRDILREAQDFGYPHIDVAAETVKAIHFMWMLFCHERGSSQKAEAAVCQRLRKVEPSLALILYGPQALIEVDARGLRVKRGSSKDDGRTGMDDYQALSAVLARTVRRAGGQSNQGERWESQECGISGLLNALFGDFDYPGLVAELLADLSPSAKKRLIESLAKKYVASDECQEELKMLAADCSNSKQEAG